MTASVLTSLGLTDLIAHSPEQYIEVASRWIGDLYGLTRRRGELRDLMRSSRLCDGRTFTRDLESSYESIWGRR
jgi:protein O-GlcNAc transferase